MKRWQWEFLQIGHALGLFGLTGLAMLLTATLLYLGAIKPSEREMVKIKDDLALLQSQPKLDRQYTPADELTLFYDFFPTSDALAEQLRTVHHLAANRKLSIEQVDYKLSKIQGTPLVRYQMKFSVNSDYISLRHYISDVLKALPNAALEEIELQRADAEEEVLDEKVGLILYFRDAS